MSLHSTRNRSRETPLACPHCREPIAVPSPSCGDCGLEITAVEGVPALDPDVGESGTELLAAAELSRLAARVEREPIREATRTVLADHDHRGEVLARLFDVERDAWQALVAPHVSGRCLDADAGFGRRAMTLAERADVVYAVDASLSKLRIAAARDDFEAADRVRPLQTTEDRLPFADGSFDAITADCTGSSAATVRARLERLAPLLADDGSLLFLADGWPRRSGLASALGASTPGAAAERELTGGTPARYRSIAEEIGFDAVDLYGLLPSARRPLYALDAEGTHASSVLADLVLAERGRFADLAKPLVGVASRTGLLERCYPSYLVVCTNAPRSAAHGVDDPLLVAGRSRGTLLETGPDGIDGVRKRPNRRAHAPFTGRETAVLSELRDRDHSIVETLPDGEAVSTPLGPGRRERPTDGRPLDHLLTSDRRSFERVLEVGFDWLIEFQTAFGGPVVARSPTEVRADLRFDPAALEPPTVDEPVETFATPVHGDYVAGNVHVRDGVVSSVIDWEYGAVEGNPIVDAGIFVLNTAARTFDGFESGIRNCLCGDGGYARTTRAAIRRYCDAVGIPPRTFATYLPAVFSHRLELDWRYDASMTYTDTIDEYATAVRTVRDHAAEIELEDEGA